MNDIGRTRRSMLRLTGASFVGAGAAGVAAGKRDVPGEVRLSGTYENPIPLERVLKAQRRHASKRLATGRDDVTPVQVPSLGADAQIVEYRLVPTETGFRQFVGTAGNPGGAAPVAQDAEEFEETSGGVSTSQASDLDLTIEGWDWDQFSRFSHSHKPHGKVTIGSHWAGKADTPDYGDYGYGICTDYEQIPGYEVNSWDNSTWYNENGQVRNKWHKGDFDPVGYEYGPTNTAGQYTYGFNVGFSGSTPEMGVSFSTTVEGGCVNHSEYDLPLADHSYKVLNKVQDVTLSMAPASTAYVDEDAIDSTDQILTTVRGTGTFWDYVWGSTFDVWQSIDYKV